MVVVIKDSQVGSKREEEEGRKIKVLKDQYCETPPQYPICLYMGED